MHDSGSTTWEGLQLHSAVTAATADAVCPASGGAMTRLGRTRSVGASRVATELASIAKRPVLRAISLAGVCCGISGLVLACLSSSHPGIAMTWGMVAFAGLSMPVLVVLYIRDTRWRRSFDSATSGSLQDVT